MPGRLRRITVYETPSRFYLVGCESSGTKYNVLKIDRVDSRALVTGEPETDYNREEILELLATVSEGNSVVYRSPQVGKPKRGLIERVSNAFGLLGVVRFLEGYYLIIITKAHVVAQFGYHSIYKISEVAMIPLAMDGVTSSNEEQRYVKLFQSVDLSTDFYFSYTYDLSRSLQENALSTDWKSGGARRIQADRKFVWNSFLLDPLRSNVVSERWFLEVVHGFVGQQMMELPCTKLSLTLIGRRSAEYAGTRFLKRGANLRGCVANDVETEQILWDVSSSPRLYKGRFSSFVQRRGSVPLRWSQDPATRGVVGKPLILIDIHEPHGQTAAAHFRDLRSKYGSPIVVMNLVKRREKRRHEGLLHDQFLKAVNYLNQFLPIDEQICYLSFDIARCNKASSVHANVLTKLDDMAMKVVQKHGWFQSFPMPHSRHVNPRAAMADYSPSFSNDGSFLLQKGVCRTNCVDCLDRTNVAQFGIGKAALACQMFSMGVLDDPHLSLQSEVCRVYEELFDDHGDTMAWQYAGSQLVHSIKTYKKTAAFQERSRDVIQTLSRYYSNTFGDYDKQAAINLFLGIFRPQISSVMELWDLTTDYYLHFPTNTKVTTDYCNWTLGGTDVMDDDYVFVDPEECKADDSNGQVKPFRSASRESFGILQMDNDDDFRDYYRTYEMTTLENKVKAMVNAESKTLCVVGINQEASTNGQFMKLWKNDSKDTKKTKKQMRDSDDEDDEEDVEKNEDVVEYEDTWYRLVGRKNEKIRTKERPDGLVRKETIDETDVLATGLKFAKKIYGLGKMGPSVEERSLYERYFNSGGFRLNAEDWIHNKPTLLTDLKLSVYMHVDNKSRFFTTDDTFQTCYPNVGKSSMRFYTKSCDTASMLPSPIDLATFSKYPVFSN